MNPHTGGDFDSFLAEEGILEEVSARARKRLLALQLGDIMEEAEISKAGLADKLHTTSDQVDQLLDPENTSITLDTLERVARALGKRLRVEFA